MDEIEEDFDPYYKWLGIREKQRPPNYYRLLGLELFEDDPEVIAEAADRQMGHVRTHQTGRYSKWSQRLLNELAKAKVCLLNGKKRERYNEKLKAELRAHKTESVLDAPLPALETGSDDKQRKPQGKPAPLTVHLSVISGPAAGQSFEFAKRDSFTVGRGTQADFMIHGDPSFSRVHFSVRVNPPVCFLKNHNERNGTQVNGKRVTETILRDGDIITGGAATQILVKIVPETQASQD